MPTPVARVMSSKPRTPTSGPQPASGGPPLVPTSSMTGDPFEAFIDGLLERQQRQPGATPRLVSSSRWGVQGQAQQGIDLYGAYDDGSTATWQCKAYAKFTLADMTKIIEDTKIDATRHVAAISGLAGSDVRALIAKHAGWEVWDQKTSRTRSWRCPSMRPERSWTRTSVVL